MDATPAELLTAYTLTESRTKTDIFLQRLRKVNSFQTEKKVLARTQLEEYTELLDKAGYNCVNTQIENEFEEFVALGGKFEKFIENTPKNF